MLSDLSIRNFAIIDDLNLSLAPGMTVLSGETGAGKSILIDALGLLLGDRADSDAVRDGEKRAEVTAVFQLDDCRLAQNWLNERELDADDEAECILRRVVSREGRSRNWINGAPANARDLAELGEFLVDIHGQHAHQSLLKNAVQRDILDHFGGHEELTKSTRASHARLRELQQQINQLEQVDASGESRLDLLRYQTNELDALNLQPDELSSLDAEHKRLANAERLIADGQTTLNLLYEGEDSAAVNALGSAEKTLQELNALDAAFGPPAELVSGALIQTREAADELRRVLDRLDLDPARLAQLDNRLAQLQDIARKHHCRPEALPALAQELETELAELEGAQGKLQTLRDDLIKEQSAYLDNARALHKAREKTATGFSKDVSKIIRELGMPQGEFKLDLQFDEQAQPAAHGLDRISFQVSANPGQAARAIERVASGGELSRISLAIQVIAAASTQVPTLVFDEVDAGIGGGVAEIVGRLLRRLGQDRQTMCVTHLPQVAAQAQQHLLVSKTVKQGRTRTQIDPLDASQRVQELARMLGGVDITEQTRAHAEEMLAHAEG